MKEHNRQKLLRVMVGVFLVLMLFPSFCLASQNWFLGFARFSSEENKWIPFSKGGNAYFRDLYVGGVTYIANATNGETWTADLTFPDGSTTFWLPLTFYKSFLDQQDCFVNPIPNPWYVCNTGGYLSLTTYIEDRCGPRGTWKMRFYNNGELFDSGQFNLLAQLAPGTVPSGSVFNQGTYSDSDLDHMDSVCRTPTCECKTPDGRITICTGIICDGACGTRQNEFPVTIAHEGCAMTSAAMILWYQGIKDITPRILNAWLSENNGYQPYGRIDYRKVARYAQVAGTAINFRGTFNISNNFSGMLEDLLCTYGPILIGVKPNSKGRPTHWVVLRGKDDVNDTYLITDPSGGGETTLKEKYGNVYSQAQIFSGPEKTVTDKSGLVASLFSPGELLITDPLGRRTGLDPLTGQSYEEIPGSSYTESSMTDDITGEEGREQKTIDIVQPMAGEYALQVTGTGVGNYLLWMRAYDLELNDSTVSFDDVPIYTGAIHRYSFNFTKIVGSKIEVVGGFDGGGQRPKDVNKFLSYSNPSDSQTTLPAGTTTYPLMIFYDKNIVPTTFKAELNGVDITSKFTPTPGSNQVVNLNLQKGRNVLVLSVDGNLPTRTARDTDRLVFIVQ